MALESNALTTLATALDELGLTGDDGAQDARIERYINAGSALFERLTGRKWYRASDYAENVKGFGGYRLSVVDHLPVVSITSIVFDDGNTTETVDSDHYEIERASTGFIRRISGSWRDTRTVAVSILPRRVPQTAEPLYTVTYTGGYITPEQAADGMGTRDLPHDIEDALIQYVTMRHAQRGMDGSVSRIGLGDGSIEFTMMGGERVPAAFASAVNARARRHVA